MMAGQVQRQRSATRTRFSKAMVGAWIAERRKALEKQYRFNPQNGWAQVEGKGEVVNRAYGEYDGLLGIAEAFDLE
jgi:hypothetical protein